MDIIWILSGGQDYCGGKLSKILPKKLSYGINIMSQILPKKLYDNLPNIGIET